MTLHHVTVERTLKTHPAADLPEYVQQLVARTCKKGETYCIRANWEQIALALRCNIPAMFPTTRIVHVYNCDMLAHAVGSLMRKRRRLGLPLDQLLPDDILRRMATQSRANALFTMLADSAGIARLSLSFEGLADQPDASLNQVMEFCGLDSGSIAPRATLRPPPRVIRRKKNLLRNIARYCATPSDPTACYHVDDVQLSL